MLGPGDDVALRSLAEKTYRVEFRATQGDLAGTGVERTICETAASAGFYRVTLLP